MTATTVRLIIAAALGVGLFVVAYLAPRASAYERTIAGPYDLNAYRPSAQLPNPAIPGWVGPPNVAGYGTFESRETCLHEKQFARARPEHIGWSLRCDPVERGRR